MLASYHAVWPIFPAALVALPPTKRPALEQNAGPAGGEKAAFIFSRCLVEVCARARVFFFFGAIARALADSIASRLVGDVVHGSRWDVRGSGAGLVPVLAQPPSRNPDKTGSSRQAVSGAPEGGRISGGCLRALGGLDASFVTGVSPFARNLDAGSRGRGRVRCPGVGLVVGGRLVSRSDGVIEGCRRGASPEPLAGAVRQAREGSSRWTRCLGKQGSRRSSRICDGQARDLSPFRVVGSGGHGEGGGGESGGGCRRALKGGGKLRGPSPDAWAVTHDRSPR